MFDNVKRKIEKEIDKRIMKFLEGELKYQEKVYDSIIDSLKGNCKSEDEYKKLRESLEDGTGCWDKKPCLVLHDYDVRISYLKSEIEAFKRVIELY